uniref:BTB domain-containing protein n=1 Tax=Cucumis melo TaxID=3656 RepID=A0A9I9CSD6_CUCME
MLPSTYIRSTETYLAESVIACFFDRDSGFRVFGSKYMENTENICTDLIPIQAKANTIPLPPPLPKSAITSHFQKSRVSSESLERGYSCVSTATRDLWDGLFDEAYGADVYIHTDHGGIVYAHAYILGMTSPVLKGMLKQSKKSGRKRSISIHGVPPDAVKVFIRYLYSCRYEKEEMEEFVLPLLMLSHVYVVPQLKRECERQLGRGLLTLENVVDVFQLALLCDAPRLSLLCHRMILKNFKLFLHPRHGKQCSKATQYSKKSFLDQWSMKTMNFKDRSKKQGRKDEVKWKLLVKKILWTKGVARTPFFLTTETI